MLNILNLIVSSYIFLLSVIGCGKFFRLDILNIKNEDLRGLDGIFGLFILTLISYLTSFILNHNYAHNIVILIIGLIFFVKNFDLKFFKIFTIIYFIIFSSFIILKTHDDFFYYHFHSSLTIVNDKIQFGLGNLGHGYKHHSSFFLFNSLTYLPFISFNLFNIVNFFILIIFNLFIYDTIKLNIKFKKKNFLFFFTLSIFLYVNIKFYRISEFGTDLGGQILLYLVILLFIINSYFKNLKNCNFITILLILVYLSTIKTYFVYYSFILFLFLLFSYRKYLSLEFLKKLKIVISFSLIFIFCYLFYNFAYTGCLIYPIKLSCFDNFFWAIDEKTIAYLSKWYSVWAKSMKSSSYNEIINSNFYNFNWITSWYNNYFLTKGIENLIYILISPLFILLIFFHLTKKKNTTSRKKIIFKKKEIIVFVILLFLLFLLWFANHPALRYGGYFVVYTLILFSFYIAVDCYFILHLKNNIKFYLIIFACLIFLIFNIRNIHRIIVKEKNFSKDFPFYYYENCQYEQISNNKGISIYIPKKCVLACSINKTPCTGADNQKLKSKKIFGYNFFFMKKDL